MGNGWSITVNNVKQMNFYRLYLPGEDGTQTVSTVELLGLKKGHGLIISAPTLNALPTVGTPAKLTLFHPGGMKTIESHIILVQEKPFAHMHLAWPSGNSISKQTQRQAPRAQLNLDCSLRLDVLSGKCLEGCVQNLSMTGAGLLVTLDPTVAPFKPKTVRLILDVDADGDQLAIDLNCVVIRSEKQPDGNLFLGVSFDLSKNEVEARMGLRVLIYKTLIENFEEPLFPI